MNITNEINNYYFGCVSNFSVFYFYYAKNMRKKSILNCEFIVVIKKPKQIKSIIKKRREKVNRSPPLFHHPPLCKLLPTANRVKPQVIDRNANELKSKIGLKLNYY